MQALNFDPAHSFTLSGEIVEPPLGSIAQLHISLLHSATQLLISGTMASMSWWALAPPPPPGLADIH